MHWNVLVFPGGSEIGLEICNALRDCKEVTLISAGMDISNHAPYVFPEHHILPSIEHDNWIDALNRLVDERSIDYIFPAYDDVIVALATHRDQIRAKLVTSPTDTCLISRFKSRTYAALADVVPTPTVYCDPGQIDRFPVFAKPDRGQGSQGTRLIENEADLREKVKPGDIVLEYLPGEEFTVDCFSDRSRGVLFAGGRCRLRVRNGISVATCAAEDPEFFRIAEAIQSRIPFHGAWFFQLKRDREGVLKLLEVAPRIAGAMAFHRAYGINFPLLSLYEQERMPVQIMRNNGVIQLDRALVNRFRHDLSFDTVYVDLDDTLVLRGAVHTQLVAFLYQCINAGKTIVLITKHAGNLEETLERRRIRQLFDRIVHLRSDEEKADHIDARDAILIDDSFSERKRVHERTGIPTFDCSMLELLLDHKNHGL